jgi:MYXO-CTERM domain-containing protein
MQPESAGFGVEELRTLEADDDEGVCAVHADSWQAEPLAKDGGGCSVTASSPQSNVAVAWLAALALALRLRRVRARSS